jgi:hypothetical protein
MSDTFRQRPRSDGGRTKSLPAGLLASPDAPGALLKARSRRNGSNLHRKDIETGPSGDRSPPLMRLASSSEWWSQTGSNRRPHACKARALPTELWPRRRGRRPVTRLSAIRRQPITLLTDHRSPMVGLGGLEPPTSRLSSARSNQLSYKPLPENGGLGERRTDFCSPLSVLCRPKRKRDEGGAIPQNAALTSR